MLTLPRPTTVGRGVTVLLSTWQLAAGYWPYSASYWVPSLPSAVPTGLCTAFSSWLGTSVEAQAVTLALRLLASRYKRRH